MNKAKRTPFAAAVLIALSLIFASCNIYPQETTKGAETTSGEETTSPQEQIEGELTVIYPRSASALIRDEAKNAAAYLTEKGIAAAVAEDGGKINADIPENAREILM